MKGKKYSIDCPIKLNKDDWMFEKGIKTCNECKLKANYFWWHKFGLDNLM